MISSSIRTRLKLITPACGRDRAAVAHTQRLIGGWASIGLLNGHDLEGVLVLSRGAKR